MFYYNKRELVIFLIFAGLILTWIIINSLPEKEPVLPLPSAVIVPLSVAHTSQSFHPLVIPAGLRAVSTLKHTTWVGTADHPTINGGVINAADGMPINHDAPVIEAKRGIVLLAASRKLGPESIQNQESASIRKGFDDGWATSQKVKILLKEAVSEGKLNYVLNKTDEMKLPASLSIVPMIESNYKTNAVSPKGAGGPWQIMPATANSLGISDEQRFEWKPATQAALAYLSELHKEFGNWNLAFAAYNAGPYRVQTALKKNPYAHSLQDLDLPSETKQYVIHMQSINELLAKYSDNQAFSHES